MNRAGRLRSWQSVSVTSEARPSLPYTHEPHTYVNVDVVQGTDSQHRSQQVLEVRVTNTQPQLQHRLRDL